MATMQEWASKVAGAQASLAAGVRAIQEAMNDAPPLRTVQDVAHVAGLRQAAGLDPWAGVGDNLGDYEGPILRWLQSAGMLDDVSPALLRRFVGVFMGLDGRMARLAATPDAAACGLVPDSVRREARPIVSPDGPTVVVVEAAVVEALGVKPPACGWWRSSYGVAMACLGRGFGVALGRGLADWYGISGIVSATEKLVTTWKRDEDEANRRRAADAEALRMREEQLREGSKTFAERQVEALERRVRELEAQQAAQPKA